MNKEYTISDFETKKSYQDLNVYMADGYMKNEKWHINYSYILSKLIQEAGRWCEEYASDLFISWTEMLKDLDLKAKSKPYEQSEETYLFGFRQQGVDHAEFILNKLNDPKMYNEHYNSIWCLKVKYSVSGDIAFQLHRCI